MRFNDQENAPKSTHIVIPSFWVTTRPLTKEAHFGLTAFFAVMLAAFASCGSETPEGVQWQRSFGGAEDEWLSVAKQTSDGGFILGGSSKSGISGNKTSANYGDCDFWVIKLDSNGNKLWENSFGGRSDGVLKISRSSA